MRPWQFRARAFQSGDASPIALLCIRVIVAALLALGLAFSGCLSGSGSTSTRDATANQLVERANEVAQVGPDASLLAVFTLETNAGAEFAARSPPAWLTPFLNLTDQRVGDGRAPAWGFYFGMNMAAEGRESGHMHGGEMADTLVVLAADGDRLFRGFVPDDFPIRPAGSLDDAWLVDSDAAAASARSSEFGAITDGAGAYSFASLAVRLGSPAAWLFEAGRAASGAGQQVAAAARDGLKINLGNRDPFAPVATESGELAGTATASGVSSPFSVAWRSHRQIEFFLDMSGGGGATQTGAQVEFVAQAPDGQSFPFHWDGSGGTNQAWFQFDAPSPGEWTLEARVVGAESGAFKVRWCALGASRC